MSLKAMQSQSVRQRLRHKKVKITLPNIILPKDDEDGTR